MVIGFVSDMCEKGLSDMIKYLLVQKPNTFKQGGIMKGKHPKLRVNPTPMITTITEIFNPVLKKPALKNLILTLIAIALSKTFRVNEIASHLPVSVAHQKTKQKRLLRFLSRGFAIGVVMRCWLVFVLRRVCQPGKARPLILIDETQGLGDFKAIVAAVPFRQRAIPIYWHIYSDDEIRDLTYKSHNEIIQRFCVTVYQKTQKALSQGCEPVLIFDRGFARARYVIKFLKAAGIPFVMRVCRNVRITVNGEGKAVEHLHATGFYPQILYHATEQIQINLYIVRDTRFAEALYLISSHLTGSQIHRCYKRRMQIEHGFRDIKTTFGFGSLILKKPTKSRVSLLWLLACLTHGLLFIIYQKSGDRWANTFNTKTKTYSLITIIKRGVSQAWVGWCLSPFFTLPVCRGDTLQDA